MKKTIMLALMAAMVATIMVASPAMAQANLGGVGPSAGGVGLSISGVGPSISGVGPSTSGVGPSTGVVGPNGASDAGH